MFPDMQLWLKVLLAVAAAFAVAFGSTPIVKSFAQKVGAIDNPGEARRIHNHPIPRMGGLAIFLGFLVSVILFGEITKPMQGILIGAVILVATGIASWKIMVSSVAGALAIGYIGFAAGVTDLPGWYQLLMGGFAFGTVFMATDPVTSAQTECGKWIYGFLIGALSVTVRLFNPGYPEGMMLAILFMNTMAPLIDHCVISASIKRHYKSLA